MIRHVLLLWFAVCSATAFADKDFSSWRKFSSGELISETTGLVPGSPGTIGLHIKLAPKWHTYWQNPGDSGTPVRLSFKSSPGLKIKQVLMPTPERIVTGPLISFGYNAEVLYLIEVNADASLGVGQSVEIIADTEWLVCEDVCIPAFDTLKITLPVQNLEEVKPAAQFALFQKTRAQLPQVKSAFPKIKDKGEAPELTVDDFAGREFVDFFPFRNSGVTNSLPKVETAVPLKLVFAKSTVPREKEERVGVLLSRQPGGAVEAWQFGDSGWSFEEEGAAKPVQSIWWMIVSAFIGGLILNLMPCVFPVLSIKLLSLMKLSASQSGEVRRQNFAYVAGVMLSFLAIALVLSALRSAGSLVGWGFQLQSPLFLSLLCWLFFGLGLNLLGVFEIDFLNPNLGNKLTRAGGLTGSFFTGVLAVVVASPCTAPFMGVALGFGLTQSTAMLFVIFLTLGLGLAFPYLIFAVFPKAIRIMPRPGRWMNVVKQVMAFPLFLTLLWLLWILSLVRGPNAVIVVLAGCLAMGFVLWLPLRHKSWAKWMAALVILGGSGFIYQGGQHIESAVHSDLWTPFRADMEALKGQRVFVNMTADWCLTCKVNERLIFNDAEILELLKNKKVTLVKGDWTQRNEDITRFLARYDRVGVPFYVLYSPQHPEGQILPEVLTKSTFKDLIQAAYPE